MSGPRRVLVIGVLALVLVVGAFFAFRSTQAQHRDLAYSLLVKGDAMTPDHLIAHQGDRLTITVSVDQAEEIHLHGYDIKFEAAPGRAASHTFTAANTGSFEIEIEDRSKTVGSLDVSP